MAFVNDFSTEDDLQKYGLHKISEKLSGFKYKDYGVCIDRERDIVLLPVYEGTPRTDDVGKFGFALIFGGSYCSVWLDLFVEQRSEDEKYLHWTLNNIKQHEKLNVGVSEIKQILKDALIVYGVSGPSRFLKAKIKLVCEFNF